MNDLKNAAKNLKKDKARKRQSQRKASTLSAERGISDVASKDDASVGDDLSVASDSSFESGRHRIMPQSLVKNTTIVFIETNGLRREVPLDKRLLTYTELQREIARLLPGNRDLFVIQNQKGQKVLPQDFVPSEKVFVRKLLLKPPSMSLYRGTPATWDTHDYHDAKYQENLKNTQKNSVSLFF